jgi:hypothetical protein
VLKGLPVPDGLPLKGRPDSQAHALQPVPTGVSAQEAGYLNSELHVRLWLSALLPEPVNKEAAQPSSKIGTR